jgi:hypothetical protein
LPSRIRRLTMPVLNCRVFAHEQSVDGPVCGLERVQDSFTLAAGVARDRRGLQVAYSQLSVTSSGITDNQQGHGTTNAYESCLRRSDRRVLLRERCVANR